MESAYGIGVQNRYALFLDEDDDSTADPYALLTNADGGEAAAIAAAKAKAAAAAAAAGGKPGAGPKLAGVTNPKTNLKPAGTLSESKANVVANQKDAAGRRDTRDNRSRSGNQSQRPIRVGDQENRTQRSPRQNNAFGEQRSPRPYGGGEGQPQEGDLKEGGGRDFRDGKDGRRNGFGGGRGASRGGFRGGPGGGQRFERKRDFNRHSGSDKTGIKATEKRDGAGAHNWGKSVDDFAAAPEDELVNGEQPAEGGKPAEGGTPAEGTEAAPGEEGTAGAEGEEAKSDEPVVKTLDEYKREREEKRLHAQFNTRKANEGEDKTKWKKTYILKKKPVVDEEEVEYEEIEVEEDSNKRRGRQILDIEVNFRPSEEGRDFVRRGRGGPGGRGRGAGPRDGPREDRGGDRPDRRPVGERGPPGDNPRPPRGNGPAGGPRGGRGGRGGREGGRFQATPKFDDLNDFPSL